MECLLPMKLQLLQAAREAGITSRDELANLMGQLSHESSGFTRLEESFRYTRDLTRYLYGRFCVRVEKRRRRRGWRRSKAGHKSLPGSCTEGAWEMTTWVTAIAIVGEASFN